MEPTTCAGYFPGLTTVTMTGEDWLRGHRLSDTNTAPVTKSDTRLRRWRSFGLVLRTRTIADAVRLGDEHAFLSRFWLASDDGAEDTAIVVAEVHPPRMATWLEWEADVSLSDAVGGTITLKGLERERTPWVEAKVR